MSIASNYMGKAPIIFNATLTYTKSMQKGEKPINFQKFHTDMLDKSLLHLVVPIKKISSLNGPFTFVDAPTSKKIMSAIEYEGGRVDGKIIKKYAKEKILLNYRSRTSMVFSPFYCLHGS